MTQSPPEFIEFAAAGQQQKVLAKQFGVTDRTIRRWLNEPQVALRIAERREEVQCAIVGRLTGLAENAFDTVASLLSEGSDAIRLRAAQMVLEQIAPAHRTLADRQADTYEARLLAAAPLADLRILTGQEQAT